MSQPAELIRLTDLPLDRPARLTQVQGGRLLTRRLLALGLRQGSLLRVIQRRSKGLVLACGELRIAVGTGIADKLWVNPEPQPLDPEAAAGAADATAKPQTPEVDQV